MSIRELVLDEAREANRAAPLLTDDGVSQALQRMAALIRARRNGLAEANRLDVEAATGRLDAGMVDRLRLDTARLEALAEQAVAMAELEPLPRTASVRRAPNGLLVQERRIPIGTVGANFEARPNVALDVAAQLLKSLNSGVLRTGGAALGTVTFLVDEIVRPALHDAGLPPGAIGLVRTADREGARELVSLPRHVPLVILRGSGETTRHLAGIAARHGVRTLQHADGGGVLYVHASGDTETAREIIWSSLDRLGVCNRLNWLLIDRSIDHSFLPAAVDALQTRGVTASLAPHDHPLAKEWALDAERDATVTVLAVDGVDEAVAFAHDHTSGLAAAVVAEDEVAAERFLDGYRGTGTLWNVTTRWLDGYRLTGAPETGINVDHVPGPRGPVTYRDLHPGGILHAVTLRGVTASGLGFPSGHAAVAAALAAGLYLSRPARRLTWAGVALMSVTRLHVGTHLPLDVVGGAAVGWVVAAIHLALGAPEVVRRWTPSVEPLPVAVSA